MKISRGSEMAVSQVKREGLSWEAIEHTQLRILLAREVKRAGPKITHVHIEHRGDFRIDELRAIGG